MIGPHAYDSDFVHNSEYQRKTDDATTATSQPRRVGKAGAAPDNVSNLERIRQAIQQIAQTREAQFGDWTQRIRTRAAKEGPIPQELPRQP